MAVPLTQGPTGTSPVSVYICKSWFMSRIIFVIFHDYRNVLIIKRIQPSWSPASKPLYVYPGGQNVGKVTKAWKEAEQKFSVGRYKESVRLSHCRRFRAPRASCKITKKPARKIRAPLRGFGLF